MQGKRAARSLGISYPEYAKMVEEIKEKLASLKVCKISLVFSLAAFRGIASHAEMKAFLRVCKSEFVLDKSQVSRMLGVAEVFGNEDGTALAEKWQGYSYTVLAEMLSLPEEERDKVKPSWTVKNVRDFKKLLSKGEKEETEEEADEPDDEFVRFRKFTKAQLCREILRLEQELSNLRKENLNHEKESKIKVESRPHV